jgi:glycerate 2-kinase
MSAGRDPRRRDLERIFAAAIAAVDPAALVRRHLQSHDLGEAFRPGGSEGLLIGGAGKAAARMALGCEDAFGSCPVRGLVIVPDGCGVPLRGIEVAEASHPLPDHRGLEATGLLCQRIVAHRGPLLFLVSGGASSLLVCPRPAITLAEKVEVNRLLVRSRAPIEEINAVRKHLSEVKGGGLLRLGRSRPLVSLLLSDVVGDDPATIGSGPTSPDPTTFADAEAVLQRFDLADRVPASVRTLLARGRRGDEPETVKPGDPETADCRTWVVGSNRNALAAARRAAERLGYRTRVTENPLIGETRLTARQWIQFVLREIAARPAERCCFVAGGETTVEVTGTGRGGRNLEFALAVTESIAGTSVAVLSAGTDGIDGPTDAAGAFVTGDTLARARSHALDPGAMLANNDSYSFFAGIGDLFRCGPTGTNVMDLKLAIYLPPPPGAC